MDSSKNRKILYVRSGPYEINASNYSLQEVGLGKAFCKRGYDFDILYYTKGQSRVETIETEINQLRILWSHGIKFFRSGLYPSILKKEFLDEYDAIIVSEYSQITSIILSLKHKNVYIYNGPYYNLFKIPIMEKFYDKLFVRLINRRVVTTFCKTKMSQDYLNNKGIQHTSAVGVGLDTDKFESVTVPDQNTLQILEQMRGKKSFLYIGSISERKNVAFIIKTYLAYKQSYPDDVDLFIVGRGDRKYVDYCHSLIPEQYTSRVHWFDFIENSQTQFLYKEASIFLLPSKQEIFGMVLLEAMYLGAAVISSHSAGAETLISSDVNGIIIDDFSEEKWSARMHRLIEDNNLRDRIGRDAASTIRKDFMWDSISEKMLSQMHFSDDEGEGSR